MKNFDLKKFLVENKLTPNSRIVEELGENMLNLSQLTHIIAIEGGIEIEDVEEFTTSLSFEEYCKKQGATEFNSNKTVASKDIDEETGVAYVDANKIDPEDKKALLDDDTDSEDIHDILDKLGRNTYSAEME